MRPEERSSWSEFQDHADDLESLRTRLERFGGRFNGDTAVVVSRSRLGRGHAQIEAAMEWVDPHVGGNCAAPTNAQSVRGVQWRHVVAYSGFEIFLRGLLNRTRVNKEAFEQLLASIPHPPEVPRISPPAADRVELQRWLKGESTHGIWEYLTGHHGGFAYERLRTFLTDRSAGPSSWLNELGLAAGLRHVSVHGVLSPRKAERWGLLSALRELPDALASLENAALARLAEPLD